jgi:hypothetical protein
MNGQQIGTFEVTPLEPHPFEGRVLAAAWIGASDGAACGPRNPARATLRRPALLIAVSRAAADLCRLDGVHM